MHSWRFRKLFIPAFFFIVTVVSALWECPLPGRIAVTMHFFGLLLIIVSAVLAFYVHSLFPKKHERPEDFERLLTDGPYRYVRHPFYSTLILIGFGIALFFESIPGLIVTVLMLPLWEKLAELEKKELLEHWGDEYRRFMETRGRFMPRLTSCPGRLLAVLMVFLFAYILLYGFRMFYVSTYTRDFLFRVTAFLSLSLIAVGLVMKVFEIESRLGLVRKNFPSAFLLASAVSLPSPLLQLNSMKNGLPSLTLGAHLSLIFLSYFLFALCSFSVYMAFSLDTLRPCGRLWLAVPPLFLLLYDSYFFNYARLPPIGDVILFAALYPVVYRKTRNSLGLVVSYMLVTEWDVWWAFGAVFGLVALKTATLIRVGVSLRAIVFLIIRRALTRRV